MSFNFFVKSNITFGRGAAEKLPEILKGYGISKVMIVYDGGVKAAGIAEKIVAQVEKAADAYSSSEPVIEESKPSRFSFGKKKDAQQPEDK